VAGTHDGEMPMIERGQLRLSQALGDSQDGGIDEADA
jgi:hypothetical protein